MIMKMSLSEIPVTGKQQRNIFDWLTFNRQEGIDHEKNT